MFDVKELIRQVSRANGFLEAITKVARQYSDGLISESELFDRWEDAGVYVDLMSTDDGEELVYQLTK